MPTLYNVIRRPLITEKALTTREVEGSLVFEVAANATKTDVKVASIRTASVVGKERKRGRYAGFLPDWKKAYVRLKAGEKVPDFAAEI
jgi:large subunit ribosomal protein L23